MSPWFRRKKNPDHLLGTGVWRHAHDRFMRAVDRYYAVAVGLSEEAPGSPVAGDVAAQTEALNTLADAVHQSAAEAHRLFPHDSLTLTAQARAGTGDLPRLLSQAATHVATAAEAATMARVALRQGDEAGGREAAASAATSVGRAREALEKGPSATMGA